MFKPESILYNNVMLTPLEVSTARVGTSFHTGPDHKPFTVYCELLANPFPRHTESNRSCVGVPVDTKEEGEELVRRIFEIKDLDWKASSSRTQMLLAGIKEILVDPQFLQIFDAAVASHRAATTKPEGAQG